MRGFTFKTADHPEAEGRKPKSGECSFDLKFQLDDGAALFLRCGELTWRVLCEAVLKHVVEHAEYSE